MSCSDEGSASEAKATDEQAAAIRNESGLLAKRTLLVVTAGSAVIALLLMVWQAAQILLLVFLSVLLAHFLRILANFISRHTPLSVAWSLALVVLLLIGILLLILAVYGPDIADGFYKLFRQLPSVQDRLRGFLERYEWGPAVMDKLSSAGNALANPKQMAKIAGIFSTAFGALGSAVVVVVLSLYFASDPKTYLTGTQRLFAKEHRDRVGEVFDRLEHALRWWLLGRIITMFIVGILTGGGLAILGVPFAFILGLLAAILNFIPNVGPLIAGVPAVMVGLSQSGTTVLYIVLLYLVIQSLEGYLISPYIQQRTDSTPPALVLIAQLVLGAGFGILGLLLASPLVVVVMVLVQMLYMRDVLKEQVKLP
jgi:predicted PurR-regulated permease PerM